MCHHCFGCSPHCSNRHDGRPAQTPPIKCPVCGRANRIENQQCKRCGTALPGVFQGADLPFQSKCLYTGKICDSPCALADMLHDNHSEEAQCPRG